MVGFRPGVPLKGNGTACPDGGGGTGRRGAAVADDVLRAESIGGDKAVVLVLGPPANSIGRGAMRDTAWVGNTVRNDSSDVAVGVDTRSQQEDRNERLDRAHDEKVLAAFNRKRSACCLGMDKPFKEPQTMPFIVWAYIKNQSLLDLWIVTFSGPRTISGSSV